MEAVGTRNAKREDSRRSSEGEKVGTEASTFFSIHSYGKRNVLQTMFNRHFSHSYVLFYYNTVQARRHGFESGEQNFLTPTFWPVGEQNIA